MPDKQEPVVPTSIAMLIGEINGTIKSEFASLKSDVLSLRSDFAIVRENHEKRLNKLETAQGERLVQVKAFEKMGDDVEDLKGWRSEMEGGAKGIGLGWKVIAALGGGSIVGALGLLGVQAAQPHKQVEKAEQVIERSVSTSKH